MLITDDFNRGSLGSGWTAAGGTIWVISASTILQPVDIYSNTAIIRSETRFPNTQYAQIDTEYRTDGTGDESTHNGPMVRGDSSGDGYYAFPSVNDLVLYKRVSGTLTYLGDGAATLPADTMVTIKISVVGTTIKGYVNGVEVVSVTDSDLTSGKPGVRITTGQNTNYPTFDNFECTSASVTVNPFSSNIPGMTLITDRLD